MNISSILITIIGIVIIIALYVMSKMGKNQLPKPDSSKLPDIVDDKGNLFTSVLDDIPATDGVLPATEKSHATDENTPTSNTQGTAQIGKQQLILFISALNDESLDGNLIKQSLLDNGLIFGDKDIYHYRIESTGKQAPISLFRVANGIEPWTLTDHDLVDQKIIGLSLVMLLPTVIDAKDALKLFVQKAEAIAIQSNGVLKNQQQQTLTDEDKQEILAM